MAELVQYLVLSEHILGDMKQISRRSQPPCTLYGVVESFTAGVEQAAEVERTAFEK
jgi:hypothetical protein